MSKKPNEENVSWRNVWSLCPILLGGLGRMPRSQGWICKVEVVGKSDLVGGVENTSFV